MNDLASRPRIRLWIGYALGLICFAVGAWVRVMNQYVANHLVEWVDAMSAEPFDEVVRAIGDIGWLVTAFGLGVVLVTLHHHFQSGRAAHGARGFEPLPPRS